MADFLGTRATIQSFLRTGLIDTIIVSYAPVLIGAGAPLFGPLNRDVYLELVSVSQLSGEFAQLGYRVKR